MIVIFFLSTFSLGSWAYPADQIALEIFLSGFDTDFYLEACPYAVSNSSVKIVNRYYPDYPECGADAYPTFDVSFDVHLRKPTERHAEVLRPGRAAVKKEVRKQRRCDWPNTCDWAEHAQWRLTSSRIGGKQK